MVFLGGAVFLLFKMVPELSAKILSSDARHKKSGMCLMEKVHVLDTLCSGVNYIVLLAMSLMFMNQQCLLNKMPLNRNIKQSYILVSW